MAYTEILSEYKWQGHKQILLERYKGDEVGYRVIIVKRARSLEAALDLFLSEVPEARHEQFIQSVQKAAKRTPDDHQEDALPPIKKRKGSHYGKGQ